MKRWLMSLFMMMFIPVVSACGGMNDSEPEQNSVEETSIDSKEEPKSVSVDLKNADEKVVAVVSLIEEADGLHVKLVGTDLPEGTHAFHIHEKGVCEAPDFKSAGGHYNPTDKNHGKDDPDGPHAGDFDNIVVGTDGQVEVEFTTDRVTLEKGKENTLYPEEGTSLVIHDGPDDYKSQPSGDAGDRIACGVIGE